jgi:hypothetical protein
MAVIAIFEPTSGVTWQYLCHAHPRLGVCCPPYAGALLVLAVDVIRGQVTGMILAFGGGVYVQIGGVECMAKMQLKCTSFTLRAMSLAAFIVGAVAIGLVLLDHEHCRTDGGEAGHDHGPHGR